jgi:integrase
VSEGCAVEAGVQATPEVSTVVLLKWPEVDLKVARATVRETKNGDPRVRPLVGKALEELRALKLQNSARSRYVFPALNGIEEPYMHFENYWHEALKAAGVEDFRFHDLGHTCASYLEDQGASLLEIGNVWGHRSGAQRRPKAAPVKSCSLFEGTYGTDCSQASRAFSACSCRMRS